MTAGLTGAPELGTVSIIEPSPFDAATAYVVDAPGHRHHLVCSSCGATISFRSCPVDTLVQHLTADTSYTIHDHLLEVFGTCPDCQGRVSA